MVEQLILHCPKCGAQHVDEGEWATRPHKTHLCAACGHEWRPKGTPTVGVRALSEDPKDYRDLGHDRMTAEDQARLAKVLNKDRGGACCDGNGACPEQVHH